jgi:hypothetical protein
MRSVKRYGETAELIADRRCDDRLLRAGWKSDIVQHAFSA